MKIVIRNFRKYTEKITFEFNPGEINLLQGPSGSGKSTIFDAIAWCLYGKEQQIYPKSSNEKNTLVRIIYNNIKIERTKPPEVFKVILSDKELLNDEADAYITSFFGSKGLWYSSSYVCQGLRNPLLTLSNQQKFELLKELTFGPPSEGSMEPSFYEGKVNSELIRIKKKISELTNKYNGFKESFESQLSNQDLKIWDLCPNFENFKQKVTKPVKKLKLELENLDLTDLKDELNTCILIELFNQNVFSRINLLNEEINSLIIIDTSNLEVELIELSNSINLLKEFKNLVHINEDLDIENLKSQKLLYSNLNMRTLAEIIELKNQCNKYEENVTKRKEIITKNSEIELKIKFNLEEKNKELKNQNLKNNFLLKKAEYLRIKLNNDKIDKLNNELNSLVYLPEHDFIDPLSEIDRLLKMKSFYIKYPNQDFKSLKIYFEEKYKNYLNEVDIYNQSLEINKKLEKDHNSYNEYLKDLEELDDLFYMKIHDSLETKEERNLEINRLCTLKKIYKKTKTTNSEEFKKYTEHLKKYNNYLDELKKVKEHNSSQDLIKEQKKTWTLKNEKYLNYENELDKFNSQKKFRSELIEELGLESKSQILKEIQNKTLGVKKYSCPNCQVCLRFIDGELTTMNSDNSDPELLEKLKVLLEIFDLKPEPQEVLKPADLDLVVNYLDLPEKIEEPSYLCPNEYLNLDFNVSLEDIDYYIESINNQVTFRKLKEKTQIKVNKPPELIELIKPVLDQEWEFKFDEVDLTLDEINLKIESLNNKNQYKRISEELKTLNKMELPEEPVEPEYLEVNLINENLNLIKVPDEISRPLFYDFFTSLDLVRLNLEEIDLRIESYFNNKRYQELKDQVGNFDLNELELKFNQLSKEIELNNSRKVKKKDLIRDLEAQKSSLKPEPSRSSYEVKKEIEVIETRINEINSLIKSSENIKFLYEQYLELEEKRIKVLNYIEYEKNLNEIKSIISEVSTNSMYEIIESINNISNLILESLFDDPIKIELSPHKTLKSGDEKLQVNLKIIHNGYVYDNFSSLSGGENDRISFAITLAVSKITGSKFLLLDECMASLNSELREKSIKALREIFSDLTIIHICHEATEGLHDWVVELDRS